MIHFNVFTFNPFSENTYLVWDSSKACIIIDPGCYDRDEQDELAEFIDDNGLQPQMVLNTHCHVDHVLGNSFVKEKYGIPLLIPYGEQQVLESVKVYGPSYGFVRYHPAAPDKLLLHDDEIVFGNSKASILLLPGHSPGHLAFYFAEDNICFAGDVLFQRSVGRTDLPGGNHQQLMDSIRNVLFQLPDEVRIMPGHGPETRLGDEKIHNPYCGKNSVY